MCNLLWGQWIRWITPRECRILVRRWELMRRGNGRRRDLRGRGRMRWSRMKRRERVWKRFGKVWGFELRREEGKSFITESAEFRAQRTQRKIGKPKNTARNGCPSRVRSAQVAENAEIERGLRTKDYRPCGQALAQEKAQGIVVVCD